MAFEVFHPLEGVYHIGDGMGVFMTLLVGDTRALLVDTGYGLENAATAVRALTRLPLTVILTHGHHDHALGAMHFEKTFMFEEDHEDFLRYTGEAQRRRILDSARSQGRAVDEAAYLSAKIPMPEPLLEQTIDLGGLHAQIKKIPGHTPGSSVVYVPERRLILTGDDWNPVTWLFFPKALPVARYRENLRAMLDLPFERALCSHRQPLFERRMIEAFASHLDDENLRKAQPVSIPPYTDIETREAEMGEEQKLVFDWKKTDWWGENA